MIFTEDSRVKIPCIIHLVRLGYRYLSLKNAEWDEETNIFPDLFRAAMARVNPGLDADDIDRLLTDTQLSLDNEDLGEAFYEKLTEPSGTHLIDFADFSNNSFHVVTELTCKNGDDEFRPERCRCDDDRVRRGRDDDDAHRHQCARARDDLHV